MAINLEQFPTSPSAKRMISYVSEEFYEKSYVGKWLYQVMGLEWDEVREIIDTLPEQAFIETATWGLKYHELKWGLPVRENLPPEERRRRVCQRRDQRAPMSPWRMERDLEGYTGHSVHIEDINDTHLYGWAPPHPNTFKVYITDVEGTANIRAIRARLNALRQSHTTYELEEIIKAPFVNEPDEFTLRRFIVALAFSERRNFPASVIFDGTTMFDGSETFCHRPGSLFGFPLFKVSAAFSGVHDAVSGSGLDFGGAAFGENQALQMPGFTARFPACSNRRGVVPVNFDGTALFDGTARFGQVLYGFGFPSFRQRSAYAHEERISRAALGIDNWHIFGGEYSFDGSRRFDANKTQEDL